MRMYRREVVVEMRAIALSAAVIQQLLEVSNCSQHYRVEAIQGVLRIRESTQHPPVQRRKQRFEDIIGILESKEIFKFSDNIVRAMIDGREENIPCKNLTQINLRKLFEFIGLDISKKPANIEESIWAAIPTEIKSRWGRFGRDMQEYIVECCKVNAEERVFDLLQTKLVTDSKRSPISFDVPKIPVRLPNSDLEGGASHEVYDLIEILNIQQRDPQNPERRADPLTRRYFNLNEVIPAREVRENILQQGLGGGPK